MKFLMLVLTEPIASPVPEDKNIDEWVTTHDASGARILGDRLADAGSAKTVRIRQDGTHVADGPFAPGHHHIAGLDILECATVDEAVAIALDHPMARAGVIEVRPFFDWDAEEGV